jgi:hypothetical protein
MPWLKGDFLPEFAPEHTHLHARTQIHMFVSGCLGEWEGRFFLSDPEGDHVPSEKFRHPASLREVK